MIKITKKVEYSLMVLKYLAYPKESLVSVREISEELKIPFDTTSKVMQIMNHHGFISSQHGVKGGYSLARDLSTITYHELVEMIEGRSFMMDCHDGPCELIGTCNITQPVNRLNDYLIRIFQDLTLDELLSDENLLALKKLPQVVVENCPVTKENSHEN